MIIIPMAGNSSRFFNEGYNKPKYQLEIAGITVFEAVCLSFKSYFNSEEFIFILNKKFDSIDFVKKNCDFLGVKKYKIFELDETTRGQAETVYKFIDGYDEYQSMLIFNIDTILLDFEINNYNGQSGYLELMRAEGEHWSFAQINENTNIVKKTTEKVKISDLCSNGIYFFKNKLVFSEAYLNTYGSHSDMTEFYIAPMYNYLIDTYSDVSCKIVEIENVILCGTPKEYQESKLKLSAIKL